MVDVVEVRYAFSGRVAKVNKRRGQWVRKGEVLAELDLSILQTELDIKLASYEKTRAEFEIFSKKNPGVLDDVMGYMKKIEQSQLNESVKEVELAKMKVDMAKLVSPVTGLIVDDGGNRVGLNVTPAANVWSIEDEESMHFEVEITADKLADFSQEREVVVKVGDKEVAGKSKRPTKFGNKFRVGVELEGDRPRWIPGQMGEAKFTLD